MTNVNRLRVAKYKCEQDFLFFVRYFFKKRYGSKFIVNSHHIKIADKLQKVINGEIKNLIINMPPRYGKTEMAVIGFIAYCMAVFPKSKFIHTSFSQDLVLENSEKIKELIESPEYQELWPVALKNDAKSKKKWYTQAGGGLYATPAGGTVTGFGAGSTAGEEFAGAIVIDDPIKPDDAETAERDKTNKRLVSTVMTRRNHRSTPIILIMQRLHDMDMTGFILEGNTGEKWEQLTISAEVDGKPLWEHKHTYDELKAMEKADRYFYSGQYLQEPIPDDGIFFKKTSFNWYENLPANLDFYGGADYAVSEGKGDYTEMGVFGVCPDGNIYISDWWSGQTSSDVWIEQQIDLISKRNILKFAGETGVIKAAVEPFLRKRMMERNVYCVLEWMSHATGNKQANARSFQALVESGRVYLPKTDWATNLLSQLCRFPMGTYDDKVDACSLFARMIAEIWNYERKVEQKHKKPDDYFNEESGDESWMLV